MPQVQTFLESNQLVLPLPNSSANTSSDHRALWGILKPTRHQDQNQSNAVHHFQWALDVQEMGGIQLRGLIAIAKDPLLCYP